MSALKFIEKCVNHCIAFWPRKKPAKSLAAEVFLIAHRGAHNKKQQIIENTDAAFARAVALGCGGIEFDVHTTADNVLVVNHDPTLNRLWGKKEAIRELNFSMLRKLVPDIPSLAEVVERYGKRIHLLIELKAPFVGEAVLADTLNALTPVEDYHLLSLDESLLASLTTFPKEAMFLVPSHNNTAQFCELSLQKNYAGVLAHYLLINNRRIKQLQLAKQKVGVGFVDSRFGLYRELNRGLQWIFSNNVELVSHYLQELQR